MVVGVVRYLMLMHCDRIDEPIKGTVPGRVFQPEELALYNGTTRPEVLIGVRGHVYDVTESKFYGPGGPYSFMAGLVTSVSRGPREGVEKGAGGGRGRGRTLVGNG